MNGTRPATRGTRLAATLAVTLLALLAVATGAWGVLALIYAGPGDDLVRNALGGAFGALSLAVLVALFSPRLRWRAAGTQALAFAALLVWWSGIEPSNDRDWQTDVAVLPRATIDGNMVTVHNIRNFEYRSETDYTPAYYSKTFDLRKLEGVDLIAVYWMGPAIAHTFVSFAFEGGDHLAVSIETRKEKHEGYSTLKGFFRQYELIYVVADERDVVRLRTNYRRDPPEDVYVYRVKGSIEDGRRVFLGYIDAINSLSVRPEFYNTLTTNCTTNIWKHTLANPDHMRLSWKILASGYVPRYLYESGRLDTSLPFAEQERRAHVNARAQAADTAPDFSRRIRTPAGPGARVGTFERVPEYLIASMEPQPAPRTSWRARSQE